MEHPVQFKIADSDNILAPLMKRLKDEGKGNRGYVAEQLRLRLRSFEVLCKLIGEVDPNMAVARLSYGLGIKSTEVDNRKPSTEGETTVLTFEEKNMLAAAQSFLNLTTKHP